MAFFDGLKGVIVKWLGIVPAATQLSLVIRENETKEVNTLKNELWYRGDPVELEQFYKQMMSTAVNGYSSSLQSRFWAAVPTGNMLIRKFHSGIPKLIVDKLSGIVTEDMNEPDMDVNIKSRWDEIAEDINFDSILKEAIAEALYKGDGAFKICVDTDISKYPLLEFYSGNNVNFEYKRGKLQKILFKTDYWDIQDFSKHYNLVEEYGKGYISYKLLDDSEREVPLDSIEETRGLKNVTFTGDFIMGVPLKFYKSPKYPDRGASIYEGKSDIFDALDEVLSTWLDAIRAGRVKQYIPDSLVPRDVDTGAPIKPDVFNPYFTIGSSLAEDSTDEIQVKQGEVDYEGLLASYINFLDCALQGLISPSTLGIDVKKLDNAESQREKEKATMYTRDTIVGVLQKVVPRLVEVMLKTEDNMKKQAPPDKYESTWEWGQYANPSFEAQVETVGKARQYQIMSIERCVDELYGDSMSEEDKKKEIELLKAEQNPPLAPELAVADDAIGMLGQDAQTTEKDEDDLGQGDTMGDDDMTGGEGDGKSV